jgi:hypothetical protein
MILSQAKEVAHHVEDLNEILSKQPNIDSWVVAKMQDVTTGLSDITHYLDGKSEFRLGGENIQAVQDSMLTNGARLGKSKTVGIYKDRERGKDYYAIVDYLTDEHIETVRGLRSAKQYVRNEGMNLQEWEDWDEEDNEDDDYFAKGGNIKDLQKKLDNLESQRSSWIGGSESRAVKKTPYDDQIDEVFSQIQYLEKHGGDKFIFPKADELKSRYGGRDLEEKTATMFARLFSENVSYSKFVNSLQTPTQKEAFRKLQLSTYQNKWKVKPIISKSSDTLRFKKIFADGGQTFAADGAKLKSEMWWENAPQKVKEETIQYFANLKMMWNRKEITLSKSQIREIQNVQQIVAKKYPEYNRLFHSKAADGAKLKSGKLTLSKLKSMIEQYNAEGRNFELLGAYNQLELWSNDNRIETGSKEDIYKALIRYRYNPKYADGTELPEEIDFSNMTDEEIITFANTLSYYDRMDEGIEEEFTDVEDAKEYLRMMAE